MDLYEKIVSYLPLTEMRNLSDHCVLFLPVYMREVKNRDVYEALDHAYSVDDREMFKYLYKRSNPKNPYNKQELILFAINYNARTILNYLLIGRYYVSDSASFSSCINWNSNCILRKSRLMRRFIDRNNIRRPLEYNLLDTSFYTRYFSIHNHKQYIDKIHNPVWVDIYVTLYPQYIMDIYTDVKCKYTGCVKKLLTICIEQENYEMLNLIIADNKIDDDKLFQSIDQLRLEYEDYMEEILNNLLPVLSNYRPNFFKYPDLLLTSYTNNNLWQMLQRIIELRGYIEFIPYDKAITTLMDLDDIKKLVLYKSDVRFP